MACFAQLNPELDHMSNVIEKVEYFDVIYNELNSDGLIPAGFRHERAFFLPTRNFAWCRNL